MAEVSPTFDDGAAYQAFMGRWSSAVGTVFLDWFAPPGNAAWLDLGCGTGVFTQLVLDTCSPASVIAVDPAAAQIDHARKQPAAKRADFRVADAQALPFPDRSFDVIASALVINFIPDRPRALAEMRRVARPGASVGGYVWDFVGECSGPWPLARALRQIGAEPPRTTGTDDSTLKRLHALFAQAGFEDIVVRPIDVTRSFANFDDYWRTQTPTFHPLGNRVAQLSEAERTKLIEALRAILPTAPDGTITYAARANAVKAHAP